MIFYEHLIINGYVKRQLVPLQRVNIIITTILVPQIFGELSLDLQAKLKL